jgi:hypothetical protein
VPSQGERPSVCWISSDKRSIPQRMSTGATARNTWSGWIISATRPATGRMPPPRPVASGCESGLFRAEYRNGFLHAMTKYGALQSEPARAWQVPMQLECELRQDIASSSGATDWHSRHAPGLRQKRKLPADGTS